MTWGSSVQPVRETIALAGAHGISVKLVAMRLISPAQPARLAAALAGVKRLLIVEQSPMPDFVFGNSASTYNPWSRNLNGASKTAANEIFAEISAPTETIAASDLQKRLLEVAAASAVIVHSIQAQVGAEATSPTASANHCGTDLRREDQVATAILVRSGNQCPFYLR